MDAGQMPPPTHRASSPTSKLAAPIDRRVAFVTRPLQITAKGKRAYEEGLGDAVAEHVERDGGAGARRAGRRVSRQLRAAALHTPAALARHRPRRRTAAYRTYARDRRYLAEFDEDGNLITVSAIELLAFAHHATHTHSSLR